MPLSENSLENGRGHDFGMDLDRYLVKKADIEEQAPEHHALDLEIAQAIQSQQPVVASVDRHSKILADAFDGKESLSPHSPSDRKEIVRGIISDFKAITGVEPKDLFDESGDFWEPAVEATVPKVKDYVQGKYGTWDDEVLYDLDDALMRHVFGSIRKWSQNGGGSVTTVRKHHKGDKARITDEKTIKGPRHSEESPTEALVAAKSSDEDKPEFDDWFKKSQKEIEEEYEEKLGKKPTSESDLRSFAREFYHFLFGSKKVAGMLVGDPVRVEMKRGGFANGTIFEFIPNTDLAYVDLSNGDRIKVEVGHIGTNPPFLVREAKFQTSPGNDLREPTDDEREHEYMRIRTLDHNQLITRLYRIKDPQKMFAFAKALHSAKYDDLEELAYERLESMGWDRSGHWGGKKTGGKVRKSIVDNIEGLLEGYWENPDWSGKGVFDYIEGEFKNLTPSEIAYIKQKIKEYTRLYGEPTEASKKVATAKCIDCGAPLNPVEVLLSGESGRCKKCIEKKQKEVTGAVIKKAVDVSDNIRRKDNPERPGTITFIDPTSGKAKVRWDDTGVEEDVDLTALEVVAKKKDVECLNCGWSGYRDKMLSNKAGEYECPKCKSTSIGSIEDNSVTAADTMKKQVGQVSSDALGQESLGVLPSKKNEDEEYERRVEREQRMLERKFEPSELSFAEMAAKVSGLHLGQEESGKTGVSEPEKVSDHQRDESFKE